MRENPGLMEALRKSAELAGRPLGRRPARAATLAAADLATKLRNAGATLIEAAGALNAWQSFGQRPSVVDLLDADRAWKTVRDALAHYDITQQIETDIRISAGEDD